MPAAPALDLTPDEVAAYVGERHAYYWKQWQPVLGGKPRPSPNGAALIVGPLWMLHRKLYREFFFVFIWLRAVEVVLEIMGATPRQANGVTALAFALIAGLFGNVLYLRRARIVIADAREQEGDLERRSALLRKRGGTSVLWPLVVVALLAVAAYLR